MLEPRLPVDEADRLQSLQNLHIVGSPPEERFDRLVRVAARALRAPMAYLSFVDDDKEWFKAGHGWPLRQLSRRASIGAHAILDTGAMAVDDLQADDRFSGTEIVREGDIRSVAAYPIRGPEGGQIGVLAVLDREARKFAQEELDALRDLAALAQDELVLRQRPRDVLLEAPPHEDAAHAKPQLARGERPKKGSTAGSEQKSGKPAGTSPGKAAGKVADAAAGQADDESEGHAEGAAQAPKAKSQAAPEAAHPAQVLSKPLVSVVEALPWPVALLDSQGVLRHHNEAWHEAIARDGLLAPQDAEGLDHVSRLRHLKGERAEPGKHWSDMLRKLLSGDEVDAKVEYNIEVKGQRRKLRAAAHAWMDGETRWLVLYHMDQTDEQQTEQVAAAALEVALEREDVQAEQRRRDRILDEFGKRLNTPVTPIMLQLHMMQEGHLGKLTDKQKGSLERVARNVERWNQACAELMRRIEGEHQVGPSDMRDVVNEAVAARMPAALKAGMKINMQADGELMIPLSEDDARRMIESFLDRAIDATPAGSSMTITAELESDHVLVQCIDGGAPIEHEDAVALFDPAYVPYAPDNASLIRISGLAESVGGRAWAEPGQSGGTVLCLSLPKAAGASPKISGETSG